MGNFPLLAENFFPKLDKKFLEQFSAYMPCCFKKYASTSVFSRFSNLYDL